MNYDKHVCLVNTAFEHLYCKLKAVRASKDFLSVYDEQENFVCDLPSHLTEADTVHLAQAIGWTHLRATNKSKEDLQRQLRELLGFDT